MTDEINVSDRVKALTDDQIKTEAITPKTITTTQSVEMPNIIQSKFIFYQNSTDANIWKCKVVSGNISKEVTMTSDTCEYDLDCLLGKIWIIASENI